jgi:hypothetical protein
VSSLANVFSVDAARRLSNAARLNAVGLVLTATGMLLQIAAGSPLYPSLAGPVVLLAASAFVLFGPGRWTPYVGLLVPLVLGIGAIIAALATGAFVDQLTDVSQPVILVGSLVHVIGLFAAVVGGVGMVLGPRVGGHEH